MEGTFVSPNSTFIDRLQIGLLYVFSSLFFFTLQLSISIIFLWYKEYRQNLCYRIMAISSLIDCVQLVAHAYGGVIVIFNDSFSFRLEKFFGSLLESLSTISFSFAFLLALNRLIVFLPKRLKFLKKQREHQLFNLLIVFCFLFGLIIQLIFCFSPYATLRFYQYTWLYLRSENMWQWLYKFQSYEQIPFLFATFCIYFAIFALIIFQRKMVTSSNGQSYFASFSQNELRLLAQAFPQFVMELSITMLWNWLRIPFVFLNCQWILFNGYKPLIYLTMNKTLRKKLLNLWSCKINKPDHRDVAAIRMVPMENVFLHKNQVAVEPRPMTKTK